MKLNFQSSNIIILTLLLGLTGCGLMPKPKFDPNDPNSSIVFGYVDTKKMSSQFEWVKIQGSGDEDDYVTASTTKKGAFYHVAVKPGIRRITKFGGWNSSSKWAQNDATVYEFGDKSKNGPKINIKKPGIHFIGAYKFVSHDGKFDLRRIKGPSQKTILKMIVKQMEKEGSVKFYPRQYKMMKKRIAKLR